MNKISPVQFITRTAMLLALAIVFQNLRLLLGTTPQATLIIGSLVNLCLIVATGAVGIGSGVVLCLITPVVALLQGQLPHPFLAPATALGNMAIVFVYYYVAKTRLTNFSDVIGVVLGAFVKWGVMFFIGVKLVLQTLIPVGDLKPAQIQMISVAFNLNQLITALIGGVIAVIVLRALYKTRAFR